MRIDGTHILPTITRVGCAIDVADANLPDARLVHAKNDVPLSSMCTIIAQLGSPYLKYEPQVPLAFISLMVLR